MSPSTSELLAALIRRDRQVLLDRWRAGVRSLSSARGLDTPSLNDHVPVLIEEIAASLDGQSETAARHIAAVGTPPEHGRQRLADGFDLSEVVAEYNILRRCVHDLALENDVRLEGTPFRILNGILDGAIGAAVQAFADAQAERVRLRREEYLGFIAHDLRTPLSAVAIAGRVLERLLPAAERSPATEQMLRSLRRNVQHLQALIEKVLEENVHIAVDTGMRLERRAFDLWPLVEALVEDLGPLAAASGARLVNGVPGDLVVYADAVALRRALQNLLANAIGHAPGGEVRVEAEGGPDLVTCLVRDNGSGIAPEALDRIFEKGETDGAGGAGLGLAIVKQLVEAHGGTVAVESRVGAGAVFRLLLPHRALAA